MWKIIIALAMSLALTACATLATPTPPPTKPPATLPTAPPPSIIISCPATYPVPSDDFRSDDPTKLETGNKPKLVEFFAYW